MEDKQALARFLQEQAFQILSEAHTEARPSVLRQVARRVATEVLSNWLTCWDPIHVSSVRAVMGIESATREYLSPLIDLAANQVLHGHVLPVQGVLEAIDASTETPALGRCVCRTSRICADLRPAGGQSSQEKGLPEVYMLQDEAILSRECDRLLEAFSHQKGRDTVTAPAIWQAFRAMEEARHLPPRDRLALFFEQTYPWWELLLAHPDYIDGWRKNMQAHHKCRPIDPTLLKAFVLAQYHARGAIFTGMEVVGEKYCICTCPGPEADRGCSLTHWHYFAGMRHALYPNQSAFHGQRKDAEGNVLPCERFSSRGHRDCLGCGCEHEPPPGNPLPNPQP